MPTPDELARSHMGLVHHVARQRFNRRSSLLSYDELASAGSVGLLAAARRFDPSRGAAFSAFAVPRIQGAIVDELRQALASETMRTAEDIDSFPLSDGAPTSLERLLNAEHATRVRTAVNKLPSHERSIIIRSFWHNERQCDIATSLGLTPGRVSQIRSAALDTLRVHLCEFAHAA